MNADAHYVPTLAADIEVNGHIWLADGPYKVRAIVHGGAVVPGEPAGPPTEFTFHIDAGVAMFSHGDSLPYFPPGIGAYHWQGVLWGSNGMAVRSALIPTLTEESAIAYLMRGSRTGEHATVEPYDNGETR